MINNNQVAPSTLLFALNIQRIFSAAVAAAQADNRAKGLPNVYSINGTIVEQLPNGEIVLLKSNK